jgi:methylated-DNA-[protein]-cysteine S-methyltransferase
MRCEAVLRDLDVYRAGELTATQGQALIRHLSECAACAGELAGLEQLALQVSRMKVRAPRSILERVLKETNDGYGEIETEIGRLWVAFNAHGITMISPAGEGSDIFERAYLHRRGRAAHATEVPARYARLVQQAAAGNLSQAAPVDLAGLSDFEQQVLLLLRRIPRGEVRPYLWLAREAGRPKAVRAVGTAMARNPVPFLLPCHRVVPASGGIGNYAFGSDLKRELLRREGTPVEELECLAESGVRYIGCKTSNIYCFPTCHHARRIQPKNRVLLASTDQAESAGYRPCMRCRPALAS